MPPYCDNDDDDGRGGGVDDDGGGGGDDDDDDGGGGGGDIYIMCMYVKCRKMITFLKVCLFVMFYGFAR